MLQNDSRAMTNDYIPDARMILLILWRYRRLVIMVTGVSMLLGLAAVLMMPKSYKASATVMLNQSHTNLENFEDVTDKTEFDDMTIQTEVRLLNSPTLAMRTIEATGLNKDPEFASDDNRRVLQAFAKHLNVVSQGQSRVLEVSFKAKDPEMAAQVVNAHINAYLESQIDFKKQQVEQLSEWFENKISDLQSDLAKKSQAVQAFRAEENLPIGADNKELVYQEISDVAKQLVPVQVHKDDMQSKLAAIEAAESSKNPDAIPEVVSSVLIQNLKAQAAAAAQKVQALNGQYGPNHPKLAAARQELDQVNRAIASETASIKTSLKNDEAATAAQEEALKTRLADLNTRADTIRSKLVTLNSLKIEEDASQKVLDNFMENFKNIQSQVTLARPDAVVVAAAAVPVMAAPPGKTLLMLVVAVFSGSLALAVVFVLETMRSGVRNFDDVRKLSQKPLGIIPQTLNPTHALMAGNGSSYREAIKRIYMSGLLNNPARTILVTSAMPKEGRTTFTISLALYMMSLGRSVAVVDADFLKPSLSVLTDTPDGPGFTDVLAGNATLDEAIGVNSDGVSIIRAGTYAQRSPDVLHSDKMHKLLSQIRQRFDYVLIDSGPLLARSEASVIAAQADGIIVVTQWQKTSQENISSMFEALKDSNTPVLGVVINKVDIVKYKNASGGSDFLLPKTANVA